MIDEEYIYIHIQISTLAYLHICIILYVGATAAYYLHKKGVDVLMIEAKEQVGGNLISRKGNNSLYRDIYTYLYMYVCI